MHKEEYFTATNLNDKCREISDFLYSHSRRSSEIKIDNSCLLVLDMQKYFTLQSSHAFIPSAPSIIPNIQRLTNTFRHENKLVIYTQHYNNTDDSQMEQWWSNLLSIETEFFKIDEKLSSFAENIIMKNSYDAFYQTILEDLLKNHNIINIYICGVMTNLCCETTLRSAFVRNFKPFIIFDSTATINFEIHKSSLLNILHGFTYPISTQEVLGGFCETSASSYYRCRSCWGCLCCSAKKIRY